jgi:LuxR family maltose regulon positive regulatory protein
MDRSGDPGPALKRGQAALARGSWEDAVASLEEAVGADPHDAMAWEALAMACTALEATDGAIEARERAYALFREQGDDLGCARVALDLVYDYLESRGEPAVANGWLQRARRLLAELPPAREHALLRIFDAFLTMSSSPAEAEVYAGEAVSITTQVRAGDVGALALALHGQAKVKQGRLGEGMSLLDEALASAIGGEFSDPQWFYFTCCCMIDACDGVRDYSRSLEWCGRLREFCMRWRVRAFLTTCRIKYTGALLWRGEWEQCETELEQAMAELAAARPTGLAAAALRLAELRRRQGRRAEAEALLERARSSAGSLLVRASLALDDHDAAAARDLVDSLLRQTSSAALTDRVAALELHVRAHSRLGQLDEARDGAAQLAEIAEQIGTKALHATSLAAAGVAAAAANDHRGARRFFQDAAFLFEACDSPFEAACARLELARSLGELDQRDAATAEAAVALGNLERIGAALEAGRARELIERLGAGAATGGPSRRGRRRPREQGALTRRQRDVLALMTQGLANRDIAARLFLSEHTVHRHIANIFGELGVTSRTAAVARAVKDGLV